MQINEVLKAQNIYFDQDLPTKDRVLAFLAAAAEATGVAKDSGEFLKALRFRESQSETGLTNGVAIPHGISDAVPAPNIIYIRLKEPIGWETIDGKKVRHVFMLAIPKKKDSEDNVHIKMLSELARSLMNPETIDNLDHVNDALELINLLKGGVRS